MVYCLDKLCPSPREHTMQAILKEKPDQRFEAIQEWLQEEKERLNKHNWHTSSERKNRQDIQEYRLRKPYRVPLKTYACLKNR